MFINIFTCVIFNFAAGTRHSPASRPAVRSEPKSHATHAPAAPAQNNAAQEQEVADLKHQVTALTDEVGH